MMSEEDLALAMEAEAELDRQDDDSVAPYQKEDNYADAASIQVVRTTEEQDNHASSSIYKAKIEVGVETEAKELGISAVMAKVMVARIMLALDASYQKRFLASLLPSTIKSGLSISLLEVATSGEVIGSHTLKGPLTQTQHASTFRRIRIASSLEDQTLISCTGDGNLTNSVLCHLAQVKVPESTYNDGADGNVHWWFRSYNFTLAIKWAPFLVRGFEQAEGFAKGIARLDLDILDESWAPWLHHYDYIVLRGLGLCLQSRLRTVFDFLISSEHKDVVFFRTFSPEHWENAAWDQGGNCIQEAPFKSKSHGLDGLSEVVYKLQVEEFGKTVQRESEYSFKLKIVDSMHAALLRPDVHPDSCELESFEEAKQSDSKSEWKKSMKEEMNQLKNNQTWELV
ncbi:hypothetical protein L7F22_067498 [Adiantum nelumboides]|nr:hypothetical protein [Adiantum nelumboides]